MLMYLKSTGFLHTIFLNTLMKRKEKLLLLVSYTC